MSADCSKYPHSGEEERDAEKKNGGFFLWRILRWAGIVLLCCSLLGFAGVMLVTLLLALNVFFPDPSIEMSVFDTLGEIAMWIGFLLAEILAIGFNILILKRVAENGR